MNTGVKRQGGFITESKNRMLAMEQHNREKGVFNTGLLEQTSSRKCCLKHLTCLFILA